MKKFLLTLLTATLVFAAKGESPSLLDPSLELPDHPRLLLKKGGEKDIIRALETDPYLARMHEKIMDEAVKILNRPTAELRMEGKRLAGKGELFKNVLLSSYAYRFTGKKAYAERAEKEMLYGASYPHWNTSHYLCASHVTLALSLGLDWTFDDLSKRSKTIITEAIIEKGLKPSLDETNKRDNWWIDAINNWGQVVHGSLTLAALTVNESDPELCRYIIDRAIDKVRIPMAAYAPDGAYPEGPGYWRYGTEYTLLMADVLEKLTGTDYGISELPGFLPSALYSQHCITPSAKVFFYCDNRPNASFDHNLFWFYTKIKDPALLYMQKRLFEEAYDKDQFNYSFLPIALIWAVESGAKLSDPAPPVNLAWIGNGVSPVAMFRSSWEDENGLYLGFKCGSPATPHGHMDVGMFFIESDGVLWGSDPGLEEYHPIEQKSVSLWGGQRWEIYRYTNYAHSVITLNHKLQVLKGTASIDSHGTDPMFMYATSDLSEIYADQARKVERGAALVDKKYFIIDDRIETRNWYTHYRWNMTTEADHIEVISNRELLLCKDGKQMRMLIDTDLDIETDIRDAVGVNTFDSPNPNIKLVGFWCEPKPNTVNRFRIFLLPGSEDIELSVTSVLD